MAEATKCSQPKFVEYTGLSKGVEYGCGGCTAGTESTCESCTGDSCNKPKATGASFECRDYEFKTDKWVVKTTSSVCQRLKDTKIMCNMPGAKADKDTAFANAGCGPCVDDSKTNGLCADCDTDKCNESKGGEHEDCEKTFSCSRAYVFSTSTVLVSSILVAILG
jgi:hypothetical protein